MPSEWILASQGTLKQKQKLEAKMPNLTAMMFNFWGSEYNLLRCKALVVSSTLPTLLPAVHITSLLDLGQLHSIPITCICWISRSPDISNYFTIVTEASRSQIAP